MQENHGRQPVSAGARDSKLTGDRDGLGVFLSGQELLIGRTLRLNHMQLEPCNLRVSQSRGEKCREHEGQREDEESWNSRDTG